MRAVIQRVSRAQVSVDGACIGRIGHGLAVLLGIRNDDTRAQADYLSEKIIGLRIFSDQDGKFNRSLRDVDGELLIVSQFTLYGDCRKGRRPSFIAAASVEAALPLYEYFVERTRSQHVRVITGRFQANMAVELVNDGPVTIILESEVNGDKADDDNQSTRREHHPL